MSNLKKFIPYIDDIMSTFYVDMLSHEQLSVFFKDEHAIAQLIEKQKQNFIDSLDDDDEQLENRFRRLGSLHYDIKVPSIDFLKSTNIWRESFTKCAINVIKDPELIIHIENYFRKVDNFMSHGYLDRQLKYDVIDLDVLIEQYSNTINDSTDTLDHLNWLKKILIAIQKKDASLAPELDANACTIHKVLQNPPSRMTAFFDKEHFNDLHERLHIDSRSLFYFIEKSDFPEVLSLYANLLSVYKITLITLGNLTLQETIANLKFNLAIQEEKENIYVATIHGAQHIINNLLNQLSLIKLEIKKHPDFDSEKADMFNKMLSEASELINKLSSVEDINEDAIRKSVYPSINDT